MRLLVLGGTVFLSHAVAAEAATRGHEVVAACRGTSGTVPDGVRLVPFDREADAPPVDEVGPVDAVVDVARTPSWVRTAVAAWPAAHWVFVSTVNVYPDEMAPGAGPADTPLREPLLEDVALDDDPDAYGRMKVGCERLADEGAASVSVVRPGLVAGPGDPSGRFGYWPARLADAAPGEAVLAGGTPEDVVQVIDVRDLAAWLVDLAEQRRAGTWDGVGSRTPLGDLLTEVASAVGAEPDWRWVPHEALTELGVQPWAGPEGLPLWLPRPAYDGMMARDDRAPVEAGLRTRSVGETARDTLAWLRETPGAVRTGIDRERERAVLGAWSARGGTS